MHHQKYNNFDVRLLLKFNFLFIQVKILANILTLIYISFLSKIICIV